MLDKDRGRRYETATALGDDIQRSLKYEPVTARSPSLVYLFRKYARRNRTLLAVGTGIAVSLVLGIVATSWLAIELSASFRREERGRHQAERTLLQLHDLLIECAIQQAFAGATTEFDETLKLAKNAAVPPDWLLTLEGCAELHRGDAKNARTLLKQAVAADPDNVSAHAMLSVAHVWNGDWESWSLLVGNVLGKRARPDYRDFDSLFLAYARFYVEYKAAAEELERVLADHPTWVVPRALMAAAWGHAASTHENQAYARRALREIVVPELIAGDNTTVSIGSLGVYLPAMLVLREEAPKCRAEADRIVTRLEGSLENPVVAHMCALYFQAIGDNERQQRAWKGTLRNGSGFLLEGVMAGMYEVNDVDGVLKVQNETLEAKVAKAYVLARQLRQQQRQEARQIFRDLNEKHSTWYVRHKLLQILLLLEATGEAKSTCATWLSTSRGVEHSGHWERKSIAFIAGVLPHSEFCCQGRRSSWELLCQLPTSVFGNVHRRSRNGAAVLAGRGFMGFSG